jgi:addiction module RelE/StbE family toxin
MAKETEEYEKYHVAITQNAEDDLDEIITYIAKSNPQDTLKIIERIQEKTKTLDHFPNRGGYVLELLAKNIKDYRQLIESPWKIIYKVEADTVTVLAILDSRRNLQDILIKKLLK